MTSRQVLKEDFPSLVATVAKQYPYKVDMPMRGQFMNHKSWLVRNKITHEHYSYRPNNGEPMNAMCFKYEADAVLFALKWS